MKLTYLLAAAIFAQATFAGGSACLRTDKIAQIRMTGPAAALATDKNKHRYDITFVAACSARHPNVFFIVRPEFLPACIAPGTALPTNTESVCVAKSVTPRA